MQLKKFSQKIKDIKDLHAKLESFQPLVNRTSVEQESFVDMGDYTSFSLREHLSPILSRDPNATEIWGCWFHYESQQLVMHTTNVNWTTAFYIFRHRPPATKYKEKDVLSLYLENSNITTAIRLLGSWDKRIVTPLLFSNNERVREVATNYMKE